ncbi:phenylacetate--CoA ligase family protein [Halioxenophilus sp. WMMB6]|uniref:phenylacetate--CoA ligase family protein n=1 Tax=Halioxenophilus sp. WMMB6 TaxID=3073815 RepID=UPI00295F392B|nr:phenylacetate--CoA ligase family protein [Halioxenophilus sp. WMMB6]
MTYPTYFEAFDAKQMLEDYPIGDPLWSRFKGMSRDELRSIQNERFLNVMARGWQVPFYQRHWGAAGVEPGDIQSLDDITKLPTYSKSDLMKSLAEYPPIGDFSGLESYTAETRPPIIFHTTSGTTGTPQPLVFGAYSREVQNLLLGRTYRFQGMKPGSTVQSCYGHGMINGGHYVRESVIHFTNAMFLSAGTGIETRSAQQVSLMRDFKTNVLVGFADYIKRLADVARESGIIPGEDIKIDMISGHFGMESREVLADAWGGPELFDWYGIGDTGCISAEGPDHDGLYIWEDAHYVEILHPETNEALYGEGVFGNQVVTCLFKNDIYPIIRYNSNDVTEIMPFANSLDLPFRRTRGFMGRSDNMVKLRGINIYPQGIGPILEENSAFAGDYICTVERDANGRDEMTVRLESHNSEAATAKAFATLLKQRLGIEMNVELNAPGSLAAVTGIEHRQKPIRLIDNRFKK